MNALTLLFLLTRTAAISAGLTVLRAKEQTARYTHGKRKLLCVSEDDGAGLIWNSNLNWAYSSYEFSDRGGNTDFQVSNGSRNGRIDCDLNSHDACMSAWNGTDWRLTNSKQTPMGPVFDRRWEDFREYNNFGRLNEYRPTEKFRKSGAFAVSVRGSRDAHMLLCDTENYLADFCYWIIIGGWSNTASVIRKCATGVPEPTIYPTEPACARIRELYIHEALSPTEWRTFVVAWNETARSVSIYDTKRLLMTYTEAEDEDKDERPRIRSSEYTLFLRSPNAMLFRFHIYSFLHSTTADAALTSPVWPVARSTNLCVEMMVGLCPECQMEIVLARDSSDEKRERYLDTIEADSSAAFSDHFPTWRHVLINETKFTDHFAAGARLRLTPLLKGRAAEPLWAVANVRACPPRGAVRYGSMEATQDYANDAYFWPNVTCQKLFYLENAVVDTVPDATSDLPDHDHSSHCPEGKLGPYCSIGCHDHLENGADCRGVVICEPTGCTCPPGFLGTDCRSNCNVGQYGHGCKQTCGWCRGDNCSYATGHCKSGCDNTKRYNAPPFCKIGIDVPSPPDIDFINETTIRAILPVREEYKLIPSGYQFVVRRDGEDKDRLIGNYTKISNSSSTMVGYSEDLEAGVSYRIACILYAQNGSVPIHGEWQNFTTRCTPSTDFEVTATNVSLTLKKVSGTRTEKKEEERGDKYSCPNEWYDLLFEKHDSGVEGSRKGRLTQLPYRFTELTPYTRYRIVISKGTAILFSRETRTLDGVPSQVRNATGRLSGKQEVTLTWDPPLYPNGIIRKYEVVLRVRAYLGCENLQAKSARNDSLATFTSGTRRIVPDLTPYARYVAEIAAHTTHRGPTTRIEFLTNQTETASEMYSNLRFEDWRLKWDAPEDCGTISGPILAEVTVTGISRAVANFSATKRTAEYALELSDALHGAETYEARVYAVRDRYGANRNESAYRKLVFSTPPKAPPAVRQLEIYEIDRRRGDAYIRWLQPEPPTNGAIRCYAVSVCDSSCQIVARIPANERCTLWDRYVCAAVKRLPDHADLITVSAVNENVSTPGTALSVPIRRETLKPDAPDAFTVEDLGGGVINLIWSHPWRTGGRVAKFLISAELISSLLRGPIQRSLRGAIYEHRIERYRAQYTEQLHLLSASTYRVSVRAVTDVESYGERSVATLRTSFSVAFRDGLRTEACDADSTISLRVPGVLNDTRGSRMFVVVNGSGPCENRTKLPAYLTRWAGIDDDENAWCAAIFPTDKYAGKTIRIGDTRLHELATNCPLRPGESYVLVVLVQTELGPMDDERIIAVRSAPIRLGQVPARRNDRAWLIPVAISLAAITLGAAAFYFYKRRGARSVKKMALRDEVAFASHTEHLEVKTISPCSQPEPWNGTPTPSDKEFLSRPGTPLDDLAASDACQRIERTSLVKLKDFEDYVKRGIEAGLLDRQYRTLPRGQTRPWDCGKLAPNKPKNRYGNLLAYDENRVVLNKLGDDPCSDYINASYIKTSQRINVVTFTKGLQKREMLHSHAGAEAEHDRRFLANDLAGGVPRDLYAGEPYRRWKDEMRTVLAGYRQEEEVRRHDCFQRETRGVRGFHLSHVARVLRRRGSQDRASALHGVAGSRRAVVHAFGGDVFEETAGHADRKRPGGGPLQRGSRQDRDRNSMRHLPSKGRRRGGKMFSRKYHRALARPRATFSICLFFFGAGWGEYFQTIDVFSETEAIRCQRANMVDNDRQYLLAHLTLVECLRSYPTSLSCDETLPDRIKELRKHAASQRENLAKIAWQDKALRPATKQASLSERNLAKNRYPDLATANVNRVYLKRYPPTDEDSDYVSAVYVDGVRLQNQYLATQLPLPGTFSDFWRMLAEYKVELIVMLQPPDLKDTTCCPIVPSGEFKPVPYINVRTKEFTEFEHYTSQKLILVDNLEKPATEQQITILCSTEWKAGRNQDPPATVSLVTLWQTVERISRGDGPIVVLCHDGVTGCGLYLALSFLLERMTVERECDICLAIRAIRRSRSDFVESLEQMQYLYDAAITYQRCLETYANFTRTAGIEA